jgi:4-hydroxy-tetrahydrodipicolinate reductase
MSYSGWRNEDRDRLMSKIRVVVAGAAGRMGQTLIRAISDSQDLELAGALEAPHHPDLGQDAAVLTGLKPSGVLLVSDPLPVIAKAEAIVDFTVPPVSVELAALAAQARIVHVIGTTGFAADDGAKIHAAARHAIIVKSGNMSLGVNLLASLVKRAARALPDFDIEIVEMHHRMKVDAPSGTALLLAAAAAEGRKISLHDHMTRARDGTNSGARTDRTIGFASLRGGTVVGEHDVVLAGPHERIVLKHIAEDRTIFARGALAAVRWGQGKKPGLYAMADVLGISD